MAEEERNQTLLPLSRVGSVEEYEPRSSGIASRVAHRDTSAVAALLPAMVETVPAAIVVVDEQLRVVVANPAARSVLAAEHESIHGYSIVRFLSREKLEDARFALMTRPGKHVYRDTLVGGDIARDVEIAVDLLQVSDAEFMCLSLNDRTNSNRERAEWTAIDADAPPMAHLERAHHLEALGHLTGTLAHDFNNLLAVILGSLEAAQRRVRRNENPIEDIQRALLATERSVQATSQILHYARRRSTEPEAVNPAGIILELRGLIERAVGEGVELIVDAHHTPRIRVAPAQLETALLNLVINARDAIDGEGIIEIRLESYSLVDARATELGLVAGDYVSITVRDNGSGMTDEVKSHVFEPFFTTKPEGIGTGLGLSSVLGTVRKLGGAVNIESVPGVGTTVQLLFPATCPSSSARDVGLSG